ncbi:hypothetical protein [Methanolobus bombayensis]|uniref:hypothetical protein n=1 Tax=Methanolobus bombayensis TaxID=38023 RepID=UPI001AE565E5|nr:hypothetical protein [Methanolobus bombayensis]MBP1909739.1 hypothetical protein [Methanolobus bombayensis]
MYKKTILLILLVNISLNGCASASTETFEEYAKDSHFITNKGTFTDTIDQEWRNTINNCCTSLPDSYSYYRFDKAIRTFACSEFIIVELKSEYKGEINDSRIDKLYQKIEAHCEENTGLSEVPVVFMWAEDEEDIIYEYDPDSFENAKTSSGFVATMGSVPVFANEAEWLEWSEKVHEARHIKELEQYFSSGPVISCGFKKYSGYIEVGVNIDSPEQVNDSILSEIYQIIEDHFEEEGISNIPVVFVWTEMPHTDEAIDTEEPDAYEGNINVLDDDGNVITYTRDQAYFDEEGNLVIIDNNNSQNGDVSSQSSPGFTSVMLVMCILILARFRK